MKRLNTVMMITGAILVVLLTVANVQLKADCWYRCGAGAVVGYQIVEGCACTICAKLRPECSPSYDDPWNCTDGPDYYRCLPGEPDKALR